MSELSRSKLHEDVVSVSHYSSSTEWWMIPLSNIQTDPQMHEWEL